MILWYFDTFIIMNMDVDKFVEQQLELLQLEHEAEINESRYLIINYRTN